MTKTADTQHSYSDGWKVRTPPKSKSLYSNFKDSSFWAWIFRLWQWWSANWRTLRKCQLGLAGVTGSSQTGYISLRPSAIPMWNGKRPVKHGWVGQRTPTGPSHCWDFRCWVLNKDQVKSVMTEPLSKSVTPEVCCPFNTVVYLKLNDRSAWPSTGPAAKTNLSPNQSTIITVRHRKWMAVGPFKQRDETVQKQPLKGVDQVKETLWEHFHDV